EFVRPALPPTRSVEKLAALGAWGVNFHDNDLVPFDATPRERDRIVAEFKRALDVTGLVVPMATTTLFSHPIFRDGAFTSHAARRHLLADRGARAGLHHHPRSPRDGRRQPRGGARAHGRPRLRPRRGPGSRRRQAGPHRPQRPAAGPLRPGPALWAGRST